jgi:hypothetical protein
VVCVVIGSAPCGASPPPETGGDLLTACTFVTPGVGGCRGGVGGEA